MVSDLWKHGLMCPKNSLKKVHFKVFKFYVFLLFFALFFKVTLLITIAIWPQIWDHISKTVFPKLFFCFLLKAKNRLETCVNSVWNCKTSLFTPLRSNFWKLFFSKMQISLIWNARLAPKVTFERYQWEESWVI